MKSSNIISIGNKGFLHTITHGDYNNHFHWKVDLTYIMPNFKIALQSTEKLLQ